MQTKHLFVLNHIRNKGGVGTVNQVIFTDYSKAATLLWNRFVIWFLCVSVILSCLFLAAVWSPAGKGLTSWLSCMLCFLVFCHFSIWYPRSGFFLL